jgi:hypothetical protein
MGMCRSTVVRVNSWASTPWRVPAASRRVLRRSWASRSSLGSSFRKKCAAGTCQAAVPRSRWRAMLTYLDGAAAQHLGQRAHGFPAVRVVAAGALAVEITPRLAPGQVVHHGEALAPEDGSAVGHGQHARVDEALQRRRPLVARAERRLRPARGLAEAPWSRRRSHQSLWSRCSEFRSNTGKPVALSLSRSVAVSQVAGARRIVAYSPWRGRMAQVKLGGSHGEQAGGACSNTARQSRRAWRSVENAGDVVPPCCPTTPACCPTARVRTWQSTTTAKDDARGPLRGLDLPSLIAECRAITWG